MKNLLLSSVVCVALSTTAAFAQTTPCSGSPAEVQACQHARHDALRGQRDAEKSQQQTAEDAERARLQAAEDVALAPLRQRLDLGFGAACPAPTLLPPPSIPTPDGLRRQLATAPPIHDTTEAVATDRAELDTVRKAYDAVRCFAVQRVRRERRSLTFMDDGGYGAYVATAVDVGARVHSWIAGREAQNASDELCIANPACMTKRFADRAANAACGAIAMHAHAQAAIATEKRYGAQSGAVDLVKLHDLGDELRISDEQLAGARARYAELTHKPFDRSLCGP